MNKFNESKLSLEKAIKIDNNYIDAYINLGLLNKDHNNFDEAEQYYFAFVGGRSRGWLGLLAILACAVALAACHVSRSPIYAQFCHTEH